MEKKIFEQLAGLKHSIDRLAGNISKERIKYNLSVKKLHKEYNAEVNKDLKNLSTIVQKVYDVISLLFKEEEKIEDKKS